MRNKYKSREQIKENSKQKGQLIIEKSIKLNNDTNLNRSKSPKSPGNIIKNMGLLKMFNRFLFNKEIEKKRDNSVKNELNIRRINKKENNPKVIQKEAKAKEDNINHKFKVIRHLSYSKFDNEESINNKIINEIPKVKKKGKKIISSFNEKIKIENKKNEKKEEIEKEENEEKELNYKNKKIKHRKIISLMNFDKKEVEKNLKNQKKIYNKNRINYNKTEINKESNVYHMPNLEDFDKPKNNEKEKDSEIKNKLNEDIDKNSSNLLMLKKSKFNNDDMILKSDIFDKKLDVKNRRTFQFYVHQAYKNRDLSSSFNKYYESAGKSREGSKIKNSKKDFLNDKKYNSRNKLFGLIKSPQNRSVVNLNSLNSLKEIKIEFNERIKTNSRNNIKTIYLNENNKNNCSSSENHYVIKKFIINNNNSNNSNKNNCNINDINKNNLISNFNNNIENNINGVTPNNSIENNKSICIKNYILINNLKVINNKINNYDDKNKKEIISKDNNDDSMESYTNILNNNIELDILYILYEKMKLIIEKINTFQPCDNECYNYIQYYFCNNFPLKISNFFLNKDNKYNISCYIKIEILCFFLCYDISHSNFFNQTTILLKTILNIIHTNCLILIYFIINISKNNFNNSNLLKKIINILEKEPSIVQLKYQEINENIILNIITNNLKSINNYYRMIIDNIYAKYNSVVEENIKFPKCNKNIELIKTKFIQYKLINIISSCFYNAYKSINNYDFIELQKFFYLFLIPNKNTKKINSNNIEKIKINSRYIEKNNKNKIIYYLPKIKMCYKYSLVLDLDETLISFQKNNNIYNMNNFINALNSRLILRPGLFEFLRNMKHFYELILFSSGTNDYVDPIVKLIEKNESFFEFVLYRQHVSFDEKGDYYKNLNLLNRDIKNILIIDDMEKNFKFHKANGICIKPFNGDYEKDINILNLLGQMLIKIRIDADVSGDIRISLYKEKKNLIYSKIANNLL